MVYGLWLFMAESALEDWIVDFKEDLWLSEIEFFHFIINNICIIPMILPIRSTNDIDLFPLNGKLKAEIIIATHNHKIYTSQVSCAHITIFQNFANKSNSILQY
jgi:hypothetical protein